MENITILYIKFRSTSSTAYKNVFAGNIQLRACDSTAITIAIKKFYTDNDLDLLKIVMFTSGGAAVMLGKHNGVLAQLR